MSFTDDERILNGIMKLSIITINYNNAEGLRKTLASVASQTFRDFEHIIVDGGSTDGSVEVIREYADKLASPKSSPKGRDFNTADYSSLPFREGAGVGYQVRWISEPDKGIYNAMNKGIEIALGKRVVNSFNRSELVEDKNKGIKMASGEYLLFLNSGDYLVDENVVKNVMNENLQEDIVYGKQMTEKDGTLMPMKFYSPEEMSFCAFLKSTLPHQCTFIRVALFDKIGMYNEQNKIVSDWEWNLVALFRWNVSLREIDVPISVYDTKGISSNQKMYELQQQERLVAAMRHFPRMMMDVDVWKRFQQSKSYKLVMWLKKWK